MDTVKPSEKLYSDELYELAGLLSRLEQKTRYIAYRLSLLEGKPYPEWYTA